MFTRIQALIVVLAMTPMLVNCGSQKNDLSSTASEDTSASGAAAEAAGGALSGSESSGTQAFYKYNMPTSLYSRLRSEMSPFPSAFAQVFCPTFRNTDSLCSASGGNMWLSYNDCSFLGKAQWSGVQELSMSAGAAACGSFPNPGANQILYRQFVQASGGSSPGSITLTSGGYTGAIDDATANLGNFDGDSIATLNPNGGYGIAVHFAADGSRSQIQFAHHISVSGVMDHSVNGSLNITESPGASTRTLNGSVTVYHNLVRMVGTSVFTNVVHSDVCCVPVSGQVVTTFAAGTNVSPTAIGALMSGKSETLTFTGCGTATLTDVNGNSKSVTLNRCF